MCKTRSPSTRRKQRSPTVSLWSGSDPEGGAILVACGPTMLIYAAVAEAEVEWLLDGPEHLREVVIDAGAARIVITAHPTPEHAQGCLLARRRIFEAATAEPAGSA